MMVPYTTKTTAITDILTTSTTQSSYYSGEGWSRDKDEWEVFTVMENHEEESLISQKEKPRFDRIVKARNTDGRLFKPMLWKPIRG